MGSARKKPTLPNGSGALSSGLLLGIIDARNLSKAHLGGVIFGCKNSTIQECLSKQLFGLPGQHFMYVKNIDPGLPLFLFNYSDRSLHGIFEAASSGQMNIDPYGWTIDGSERTFYPAQVQIRVRLYCQPLLESQFEPIISDNYYNHNHFWFELDHAQTDKLISLFSSKVIAPGSFLQNTTKWRMKTQSLPSPNRSDEGEEIKPPESRMASTYSNQPNGDSGAIYSSSCLDEDRLSHEHGLKVLEKNEKEAIHAKLLKLANRDKPNSFPLSHAEEAAVQEMHMKDDTSQSAEMVQGKNIDKCPLLSSDFESIITQLMQEIADLRGFKNDQIQKMVQMQQKLTESETEIRQLKDRCTRLEFISNHLEARTDLSMIESLDDQQLDLEDIIFLVGGFDEQCWLSSLDLYSPSRDMIRSKRPLHTVRSYTSVANMNGHLYVIGGGNGSVWYDTVESYNPSNYEWTSHPSLRERKGSLAAATLSDKIFAVGGGNGFECFSDVEMFDLDVGTWIPSRSMLQKRFALAAVELNNVLYVAGGFDGKNYLSSAERLDPREHSWSKIGSMNSKRGSHSLVLLQEKVYALGGFDGTTMVPSTEVFDPRKGTWTIDDPMNCPRGYSAAAVLKDSIYVIGGVQETENVIDTVERYEIGKGWQLTNLKGIGKRCFSSAIVM
ncbi:hypothetical protein Ancab_032300 [Ancistrocladus abbreviatus]